MLMGFVMNFYHGNMFDEDDGEPLLGALKQMKNFLTIFLLFPNKITNEIL